LNLGFGGEDRGGVYHSIYDDFAWYSRFSDGEFVYGRALARTVGTILLRTADAELLPFDFTPLADSVQRYVGEVRDLAKARREETEEVRRETEEGIYAATSDVRHPVVPPRVEPRVPYFDFSPLEAAGDSLSAAAREFQRAAAEARGGSGAADRSRIAAANAAIRGVERALTRPEGLPGRPWFRHYVYAPGFYTGYDVKTLPAVREAIEQKQWPAVNGEIVKTAQAIEAAAARIREAAEKLKS